MSGGASSACCAPATLDESSGEKDIEDVPRDDGDDGEEEEEEEPPFTQEEVAQMHDEIRELAQKLYTSEEEYNTFLSELEGELEQNKDLQEQGHILLDVLEYLQNPDAENDEGDEGDEEGDEGTPARSQPQGGRAEGGADEGDEGEEPEPYPGPEGLQELWTELQEVCSEEDVKRLEEELEGKSPEEQWNVLIEVYDYLEEEQRRDQEDFKGWKPSAHELEVEWKELMARVPAEDLDEVTGDWEKSNYEDKKQMLWDVRKIIDQEDDEAEGDKPPPKQQSAQPAPRSQPPSKQRGSGYDDSGKSEVRRRGGRRADNEDLEYDFERAPDGGDWDEYYNKEVRRAKGGRSYVLVGGALLMMLLLALLLTATLMAEEDQSVMQSAMGLLRLSS